MTGFIHQLRKRGVLRVAGLYIALIWLLLQIADVVFPAFDIPDQTVRYILAAGLAGFPVVLLLAWFFELTDHGLIREDEIEESGAHRLHNRRFMTIATVAALTLALGISVFINVKQASDVPRAAPANISLLIADIDNRTGDTIFDGSLEQSLAIGLEGASFITSFGRQAALEIADKISEGDGLTEERARLVALREGIKLVLSGAIDAHEQGYALSVTAKDSREGSVVAEAEVDANGKMEVLQAVGELTSMIREELGDASLRDGGLNADETFSTASLEAVSYYTRAQTLTQTGQDEEAIPLFRRATEEDPQFGRAYSGWALSEYNLGNEAESAKLWEKTLSLLGSMTERERYRTLGLYYTLVSRNFDKAIENYELLVEKFPADAVGRNNLAVTYFYNMQFDKAREQGRMILEIYPGNPVFRSNYALFAMYSSDLETARKESEKLLQKEPDFYKAYLPIAMERLVNGDAQAAAQAYRKMLELNPRAASLARMGLGDIALLQGDHEKALTELNKGLAADEEAGNKRAQADKLIAIAQAKLATGDTGAATAAITQSLSLSSALAHIVPAAKMYIAMGDIAAASELQRQLEGKLQAEFRAAASLIKGNILLAQGDTVGAVDALRSSREMLDSWLIHFDLGRAYYGAGYYAEALSEFELCNSRIGEATSIYLDDNPSFRYSGQLKEWLAKTRAELGIQITDPAQAG